MQGFLHITNFVIIACAIEIWKARHAVMAQMVPGPSWGISCFVKSSEELSWMSPQWRDSWELANNKVPSFYRFLLYPRILMDTSSGTLVLDKFMQCLYSCIKDYTHTPRRLQIQELTWSSVAYLRCCKRYNKLCWSNWQIHQVDTFSRTLFEHQLLYRTYPAPFQTTVNNY